MNIDAKILNRISANRFSSTSKTSYTMVKLGFFQGCKDSSICGKSTNVIHYINKLNDKTNTIIPLDAEKASDKLQHPFMIQFNSI